MPASGSRDAREEPEDQDDQEDLEGEEHDRSDQPKSKRKSDAWSSIKCGTTAWRPENATQDSPVANKSG